MVKKAGRVSEPFSIVIPCHNEAETIRPTVEKIEATLKGLPFDIIAVNDCSVDSTGQVLQRLASKYGNILVVDRSGQRGFGRAVKEGISNVKAPFFCLMMADSSDDPATVISMYKAAIGGADVVIGARFIPGGNVVMYPLGKLIANRLANRFYSLVFMSPVKDFSNAFKFFRTGLVNECNLSSDGFPLTVEMVLKPLKKKARIVEVPTVWTNRKAGKAKFNLLKEFLLYWNITWECYFWDGK